jgi:hypothetical protein
MRSIVDNRDSIGTGKNLEILIHSGGGHPDIAYRVMKFFRRRFEKVSVIVPLAAKSAATLMCFAADRIYMGELADLGPVDIQLNDPVEHGEKSFSPLDEFKSIEFMREQAIEWMDFYAAAMNDHYGMSIKEALKDSVPLVTALLRPVFEQIDPVEMGEYRRAIAMGEDYAKRMLMLTGNPRGFDIVQQLVWGYASHDFCIDADEASGLGLPVEMLDPQQDKVLTDLLLNFRGDIHGFAPPVSVKPATAGDAEPLRKSRKIPPGSGKSRRNGSDGSGTTERSKPEEGAIRNP